jgi:signal peptidase II
MKFFGVFVAIIFIDQLSKHWASLSGQTQINTGISFGLLAGPLLTLLLIAFFIMFCFWSFKYWRVYPVAWGLLLGGAASNIVDRLVLGGVRDFLPLLFWGLKNNLADWSIVLSLLYLAFSQQKKQSMR